MPKTKKVKPVSRGKPQEPKGFSYREALHFIEAGRQVARHGWTTEWLEKAKSEDGGGIMFYDDGVPMPWLPGNEEITANDWELR